ncbi:MAG: tRNA lysidine(34) synthetase TilS [Clostridia bacterium]|nr:tRNA lysidine(34) synthetase TilS [Clostridia bacterium]
MDIFEKARQFIEENGIAQLINNSDAVLVAYSGGADSSALLHFLCDYLKNSNVMLAAAHLNHMIRGAEAEYDQSFCEKTAKALSIPFYTKNIDIPKIAAESKKTLEEAARDERYAFLSDIAQTLGENTLIATAHNSTDNLETLIFNLARGTGIAGIGGIAPVRRNIIRPLLCVSGEDIREYLKENNIKYVVDSTNADTAYTRNHIRKNIVPLLKEINSSAEEAALRLSKIARSESQYIQNEAEKLIYNGAIKRTDFDSAHPALKSRAILTLYKYLNGSSNGLSSVHLDAALDFPPQETGELSLPCTTTLFFDKDVIYMSRETHDPSNEKTAVELRVDGITHPFGKQFAVALCEAGKEPIYDANIYNLFIKQSTSFDTIYGSIFVRERLDGDKILSKKMHKKLKKLMCDKKIPIRYRNDLPVFCDDNGILWVPTVALRDNANGNDITMYVFKLKG